MSRDNYSYQEMPTSEGKNKLEIWDMLSILMLILTLCTGVYYVFIFLTPQSSLNPFQPGPSSVLPTPTITEMKLPPTWTVTPSLTATETPTLVPTYTIEPSATPFSLITPTETATPTATPEAAFSATVTYIASTIIHQEAGCNWQGIGGTVVDANNTDMLRMTIRLAGKYDGKTKTELTVSSIAPAYGKSGFEFVLGTVPISSKGELYIQLLDQAGVPLSDNIYLDTFNDCTKNLTLVRFKKNP
jgi:hypothetical protein